MYSFKTRLRRLEARLKLLLEKKARLEEQRQQERERLRKLIPLALTAAEQDADEISQQLQATGIPSWEANYTAWQAESLYRRAQALLNRASKHGQDPRQLVRELPDKERPEPISFWFELLDAILTTRSAS